MHHIHGNFLGATIVCIINLILVDVGAFKKPISRPVLIAVNVVLDALIIIFMGFFFKSLS